MASSQTIMIPPYGHSLAGTLREIKANAIASRIELSPATPFSGDPEFDSTSLSAWTQANGTNATTVDANTTRLGWLYIELNANVCNNFQTTLTAPFVYQVVAGDFDVYTSVALGSLTNFDGVYLLCQNAAVANDWLRVGAGDSTTPVIQFNSCLTGTGSTIGSVTNPAKKFDLYGGRLWVRMKRATNTFTGFYSYDGFNWTTFGSVTRADFSGHSSNIGISVENGGSTSNTGVGAADFLRTWPPYDTTSPVSTLVVDSGAAGTTWTPSTFSSLENPPLDPFGVQTTIGYGTLKYRIAAGETNPPTLSGSALSEAGVQALSAITGRYLKIEVTYISADGYEMASWAGAKIQQSINRDGPLVGGGRLAG